MKSRIIVKQDNTILYEGRIINLPIKEEYITKLSVEIFDDDDPCIIHQSYVIKEIVSELLNIFKVQNKNILNGSDFIKEFDMVDFPDISSLTFEIVVK